MVKTTVYLPEDLKDDLARVSDATGTSEAELIREAVRELVLRRLNRRTPRAPLFDSGEPSLARNVDDALAEGFGRW